MLEYLKRKLNKLDVKPDVAYPLYYEENGILIKEISDGSRYEIALDANHQEIILRKLDA
ncbi:MAG: hypothetical protein IJC30_02710 [Alphaproteobacteria bacterium]|nr:hypothetical protein [Alphaproteobacteria bacterium]